MPFPTENTSGKIMYPAIAGASKKWTMPVENRNLPLSPSALHFRSRHEIRGKRLTRNVLCSRMKAYQSACLELSVMEHLILTAFLIHQFFMRTDFDNLSLIDNDNLVGITDR